MAHNPITVHLVHLDLLVHLEYPVKTHQTVKEDALASPEYHFRIQKSRRVA